MIRRQHLAHVRRSEDKVVHGDKAGGGGRLDGDHENAPVGVLALVFARAQFHLTLGPAVRWQVIAPLPAVIGRRRSCCTLGWADYVLF